MLEAPMDLPDHGCIVSLGGNYLDFHRWLSILVIVSEVEKMIYRIWKESL